MLHVPLESNEFEGEIIPWSLSAGPDVHAEVVSDESECESRVHTRDHGESEAPDRLPDSVLYSGSMPLEQHRPPPSQSILSPGGSSWTESFIAVYIDDILVFSKNEKEHAKHLEKMLKICEDNGLVLSPTKMKLAVSTVDFLGAVIGKGTIKLQPHIIKKIVNFNEEELKTKKGLRSFLGILNYARTHIPKLGILLRPLYEKTNAHGDKRMKPSDYKLVRKIKE
nr:ORFIII-like polyprotein [Tanacetum cinerariifolium]